MAGAIKIEGVGDVKAALSALDAKVQTRFMRSALRASGEVMQAAEAAAAPVRPALPSGTALPPGALKSDVTLAVRNVGGRLTAVVQPGKFTFRFARWVEYGHRLVKGGYRSMKRGKMQGAGHQIGDVPAHPYIRPAFESSEASSFEAFVKRLAEQLKGKA